MFGLFLIDIGKNTIIKCIMDNEKTKSYTESILQNKLLQNLKKQTNNNFYFNQESNILFVASPNLIKKLDIILLTKLPIDDLEISYKILIIRIVLYLHFWKEFKFLQFSPHMLTDLFYTWLFDNDFFKVLNNEISNNNSYLTEDINNFYLLSNNIVNNNQNQNELLNLINGFLKGDKKERKLIFKDIIVWLYINKIYLPDIYEMMINEYDDLLKKSSVLYINLTLNEIMYWQDWKLGIKFIDKLIFNREFDEKEWTDLLKFSFSMGELTYNLFRGSNVGLIIYFFEKTLNFISKTTFNQEIYKILSATIWYLGQIEFERGYSINAAEYQLNAYNGIMNLDEHVIPVSKSKIESKLLMALYQGATDLFISSKISAQSFQTEQSKTYLIRSLRFLQNILNIINESFPIITQIKTLTLQIHGICDRENFLPSHTCDIDSFEKIKYLKIEEIYSNIKNHLDNMNIDAAKIFWVTVIDKGGITLFSYDFEENSFTTKNTLYASFIHIISRWGEKELASGPVKEFTFSGNSILIEPLNEIEIIAVVSKSSVDIKSATKEFANGFANEFNGVIENWNGSMSIFEKKGKEILQSCYIQFLD